MSYYRATLEDFKVGRVFEERGPELDKWVTTKLAPEHYDLHMGHNQFMEILLNLHRFKRQKAYYRIKHLDNADIEVFGFDQLRERHGENNVFKLDSYTLHHNPDTKVVEIFADNNTLEGVHMERLFIGTVLDLNELKTLLEQLGVLISQDRHFKSNNTVKNFDLYNG